MDNKPLITIAIVGRPNVGKSTLFNRLIKKRQAIETDIAGTTRDRLYSQLFWRGREYRIIDTAGLLYQNLNEIETESQESTEIAIEEADIIIFTVDYKEGITDADMNISRILRKRKNVLLVVNKCDSDFDENNLLPFKRLGIENMVLVSAISGRNTGDLMDSVLALSENITAKIVKQNIDNNQIKLSIIGRPNAGKSTLLNTVMGEKKMITSPIPGTTRDIQEYSFSHKGKNISICDTAGLKRKSKVKIGSIEGYALLRSYRTIRESQVAVYMIDVAEGVVAIDQALLGEIVSEGKSLILAVNKIDLWQDVEKNMSQFIAKLRQQLNFMPWLPVVFISAQKKQHIDILLNQVIDVYKERFIEISEEDCAILLSESKERNSQINYIKSLIFVRSNPIIFKVVTKKNKKLHFSHIRFLENRIREIFPCRGNPIFIDHLIK